MRWFIILKCGTWLRENITMTKRIVVRHGTKFRQDI